MPLVSTKAPTRTITQSEFDNLVRWTPQKATKGHVESYFLKWNLDPDPAAPADEIFPYRAFWLKFTLLSATEGRFPTQGDVWAVAFDSTNGEHVAIKNSHPPSEWDAEKELCYMRFGDSVFRHNKSSGEIRDQKKVIRWDISWTVRPVGVRQLTYEWMYRKGFPKNKMATPQPDTRISGWVEVNGQRVTFSDAPGMQGHNWGVQHPSQWVWAHCNAFSSTGRAVFEGVSSPVKLGPVGQPWLTILYAEHEGEPILINQVRSLFKTQTNLDGLRWEFDGANKTHRIKGWFEAPPDRFAGLNYHNPDGTIVHCLNSKVADGAVQIYRRKGREEVLLDTWTVNKSAALEIAKTGDTHGVRIIVP